MGFVGPISPPVKMTSKEEERFEFAAICGVYNKLPNSKRKNIYLYKI